MEQFLVITKGKSTIFSKIKPKTPKMIAAMKKICEEYKEMFKDEFKLRVVIKTSKGFKLV